MENADAKRALAEAKFEQAQKKAAEGAAAMQEYEANANSQRAKTERLRALRLARDAAEAPPEPVVKKRKVAAKK